jgi:hypothetical protein
LGPSTNSLQKNIGPLIQALWNTFCPIIPFLRPPLCKGVEVTMTKDPRRKKETLAARFALFKKKTVYVAQNGTILDEIAAPKHATVNEEVETKTSSLI